MATDKKAAQSVEFPKELLEFIEEWKIKPGSLVMILHKIQETFGYISRPTAEKLAHITGIHLARIYGVITFYHFFKTVKPGKHRISICLGTACYLKGGQDLIEEAWEILGIKGNEVSKDGLFSIDPVRCIGCCGLAPVLNIDGDVYGKLTKARIPEIIASYK